MSISDDQFRAWCTHQQDPVVLIELDYQYESGGAPATGTRYMADKPYFDDVGSRAYEDCVNSVPRYSRSLSGDRFGQYQSSIGSLELDNADGEQDDLLELAIDGSPIRFYLGDASWPRSDFRLIFSAMAAKASAPAFDRVSVQLKDTGVLIDKSIGGEQKVGGTGPNADRWRPINFGFVHQVECMVVNTAALVYVHSDTGVGHFDTLPSAAYASVVRDRGVPVTYTDNGDGTFTLPVAPDGVITTDTLYAPGGVAGYRCVSDAMEHFIGTRAGLSALGLYYGAGPTYAVRPSTGIAAWVSAGGEDYLIGISISDTTNVVGALLPQLVASGLCFWSIRRDGMFTYGRLRPNYIAGLGVTAAHIIREDDIRRGSFKMETLAPEYHQLQAITSKNWSIQSDLAGVLTPEQRATLTRKGLYAIQDDGVGTDFANSPELYNKTLVPSPLIETLLSGGNDAIDQPDLLLWMETRRAMNLPWVQLPGMTVGMDYYDVELGDPVTLEMARYGWDAGVDAQCIGVDIQLPGEVALRLIRRHIQGPYASRPTTPIPDPPFFLLQLNGDKILQLNSSRVIRH